MKPKVFQYIVLSLLLFFCTSACNDSDARENSNQPLPSTPEEGQVEEAGPFMRGTTYEERGKSLIDCMLRVSPGKGYSIWLRSIMPDCGVIMKRRKQRPN